MLKFRGKIQIPRLWKTVGVVHQCVRGKIVFARKVTQCHDTALMTVS